MSLFVFMDYYNIKGFSIGTVIIIIKLRCKDKFFDIKSQRKRPGISLYKTTKNLVLNDEAFYFK